jgi:hypothetical protein
MGVVGALLSLMQSGWVVGKRSTDVEAYVNVPQYQVDCRFETENAEEHGDDVTLAPQVGRTVRRFAVNYYAENLSGNEQVRVRFYENDGITNYQGMATPGTVIYDSGRCSITATGCCTFTLSRLRVDVPETFTWTVQFFGYNQQRGESLGLMTHDPPSVGTSYDDFWRRLNGHWTLNRLPLSKANFGARIWVDSAPPGSNRR